MNTNSSYNWALTRVDSRFNTVWVFLKVGFKVYNANDYVWNISFFFLAGNIFVFKKHILSTFYAFNQLKLTLSQFYKEPIYVADSLIKNCVEVRAT